MAFPTAAVDTTDLDADTDSPLLARQDILDAVQKLNQIMAHVTPFAATLLDDADAGAVRATIGAAPTASPTFTGTVTAPTFTSSVSVVTPLVSNAAALVLEATGAVSVVDIKTNGAIRWEFDQVGSLYPNVDGAQLLGAPSRRISVGYFQSIDSASGALVLKGAGTTAATITGANVVLAGNLTLGASPTLAVASGSLSITPAVVIAGASLSVGTNPSTTGAVNIPYATSFATRNQANGDDLAVAGHTTLNSVTNTLVIGDSAAAGTIVKSRSGGAAPIAADLPAGFFTVWRDTVGATTKLYYNNGGTIQSVALA